MSDYILETEKIIIKKLKRRLGYEWKKITLDEIDFALKSISSVLTNINSNKKTVILAQELQELMIKEIPEHFV